MKVIIKEKENPIPHYLGYVKEVIKIDAELTLCDELKNTILVVHKTNHCEKYRLYKDAEILGVEEEK